MSQKVRIVSVKHSGAPVYLGNSSNNDSYSCNPQKIMDWLCNGYRARFNQHRSKRKKYSKDKTELLPIGDTVTDIKDSEARKLYSFMSALPSMVIQSAERKENEEWFAAAKRKKTCGGRMPRFKSKKHCDQTFVCWARGTSFQRTGRKTGIIVLRGQNPRGKKKSGHKGMKWAIKIRVRLTQDIREYTSVIVNWTKRSIVFTNPPVPITIDKNERTPVVGCDRGGVVALTTSDGKKINPDKEKLSKWERRKKYHQAKMGKARARANKRGGKKEEYAVMGGDTYQHHKKKAAHYSKKAQKYVYSFIQEITTELVRNYDTVILEDLKVKSMTRRGGNRKKKMNKSFLSSCPSMISQMLEYKSLLNGNRLAYVPARYTSQRCSVCGHTAKENRESQARFLCKKCGHRDNADINAAVNISSLYQFIIQGTDLPAHKCANDSGEIVRPAIPSGMVDTFYRGVLVETADPSTCNKDKSLL